MNRSELIDLLANRMLGILAYDDAHPEVGMGMFWGHAFELAKDAVQKEAARWDRDIPYDINQLEKEVIDLVREKRK